MSSNIQKITKSSRIVNRIEDRDMGTYISSSHLGGDILRTGVVKESFQIARTVPDVKDSLKMNLRISVSSKANSLTSRSEVE